MQDRARPRRPDPRGTAGDVVGKAGGNSATGAGPGELGNAAPGSRGTGSVRGGNAEGGRGPPGWAQAGASQCERTGPAKGLLSPEPGSVAPGWVAMETPPRDRPLPPSPSRCPGEPQGGKLRHDETSRSPPSPDRAWSQQHSWGGTQGSLPWGGGLHSNPILSLTLIRRMRAGTLSLSPRALAAHARSPPSHPDAAAPRPHHSPVRRLRLLRGGVRLAGASIHRGGSPPEEFGNFRGPKRKRAIASGSLCVTLPAGAAIALWRLNGRRHLGEGCDHGRSCTHCLATREWGHPHSWHQHSGQAATWGALLPWQRTPHPHGNRGCALATGDVMKLVAIAMGHPIPSALLPLPWQAQHPPAHPSAAAGPGPPGDLPRAPAHPAGGLDVTHQSTRTSPCCGAQPGLSQTHPRPGSRCTRRQTGPALALLRDPSSPENPGVLRPSVLAAAACCLCQAWPQFPPLRPHAGDTLTPMGAAQGPLAASQVMVI
ncbi:fatty-acid amide hydrolase 1-like [Platysternon megacephalum]|uniref:Fatty-acid amide hydrolase 1-like n=1 Tax=Platysternon megacephalum TaxID=55544 RepID=A0A4D9E7C1_9SAUR|nr:fatty-acid amide hydrolase 1-like [Platysternon megacephalum]